MARPGTVAGKTVGDVGEFGLIDIIKEIVPVSDPRLVVGIGDDSAALRQSAGLLMLSTCDIQVEGRHFRREHISARQLGRRSAAISLSDIAAMGGRPLYALVSLALPRETLVSWVQDLYEGLAEETAEVGSAVIGGNLSGASEGIVIDITFLGEVEEGRMLRRSGARPGDAVLVTGAVGASTVGRLALERGLDRARPDVAYVVAAHLTPTPRVREGAVIAASRRATAMIDVSDGLAGDIGHICEASNAGVRLFAGRVPMDPQTVAVAQGLGIDPLHAALHGGEDYELLFTCPPEDAEAVSQEVRKETGTPVTEIGVMTEGPQRTLALPDGGEQQLTAGGWDHFVGANERS